MDNIIKCIAELSVAERASRPICKARRLVDIDIQYRPYQPVIADLVTMPQHHCRNLRIKQGYRQGTDLFQENFQILMRRMKHFHDVGTYKQVPQGLQIDAGSQWINRSGAFAIADLHKAKLRVIGVFAHELCIDSQKRCGFKF